MLKEIAPLLPVKTPDIKVDNNSEFLNAHYKLVPGNICGDFDDLELTDSQMDNLAKSFAAFLIALHSIKSKTIITPPDIEFTDFVPALEYFGFDDNEITALQQIHSKLSEILSHKDVVLCHNDLHGGNILVDDDYNVISVIDWADCCVGDRAQDFAHIPNDSELMNKVIFEYEKQSGIKINRELASMLNLVLVRLTLLREAWMNPGIRAEQTEDIAYYCLDLRTALKTF